jgi:outer membrane protein OmpA-like peptidoglycan-associated protein
MTNRNRGINRRAFIKTLLVITTISGTFTACSVHKKDQTSKPARHAVPRATQKAHTPPPDQIQQLQEKLAEWQLNRNSQTGRLVVTLDHVLFEKGKTDLRPEAQRHIETVATFLKQHPELKVSIEGHTDNKSTHQHNLGLSERRATTVQFALIKHGVSSKRLIVKGFGDTRPLANNRSEAGRQKNRRVELIIFK